MLDLLKENFIRKYTNTHTHKYNIKGSVMMRHGTSKLPIVNPYYEPQLSPEIRTYLKAWE